MIKFLIDPFTILLILGTAALAAKYLEFIKAFRWFFAAGLCWFFIISTPFIPILVLDSLESRYVPIKTELFNQIDQEAAYQIVVLDGGHDFDHRLPPNSLLSSQAVSRLVEGIRLHRKLPGSRLILSGYSASGRKTQAEMLRDTALLLGIAEEDILLQKEPANTWQEAKIFSENSAGHPGVILVTNAAHMPRAIRAFSYFGTDAIASPTYYRIKKDPENRWPYRSWLPSLSNISLMRVAIYEYAAIARDSFRM